MEPMFNEGGRCVVKPYGRWKLCGETGRGVGEGRSVEKQFLRISECDTVAAQIGHHNEMKRPVSAPHVPLLPI